MSLQKRVWYVLADYSIHIIYLHLTGQSIDTYIHIYITYWCFQIYLASGSPGPAPVPVPVPVVFPPPQTVPIDYDNLLPWNTDYKGIIVIQPKCILDLGKGQLPIGALYIKISFNDDANVKHVIVSKGSLINFLVTPCSISYIEDRAFTYTTVHGVF